MSVSASSVHHNAGENTHFHGYGFIKSLRTIFPLVRRAPLRMNYDIVAKSRCVKIQRPIEGVVESEKSARFGAIGHGRNIAEAWGPYSFKRR